MCVSNTPTPKTEQSSILFPKKNISLRYGIPAKMLIFISSCDIARP